MTAFRADPIELSAFAAAIERSEPFSGLAAEARRVETPSAASAGSASIGQFIDRLARELAGLTTATGSLGHATRSAAAGYQGVDDSIRSMSTP